MDPNPTSPPPTPQTHIHDLTDDILSKIFALVGNPPLPISRPKYRDIRISHPLHCTLICTRWRSCAPSAVLSLSLSRTAQQFHPNLAQHLSLPPPESTLSSLRQIALATPTLETLELELTAPHPHSSHHLRDLSAWTRLKHLSLSDPLEEAPHETLASLLDLLPSLTSLETLHLPLSNLDPGVTWETVQSHMTQLTHLHLQWMDPPPPSMAAFPSLSLQLRSLPPHVLNFRNVVHLECRQIEEELPSELGEMVSLRSLSLDWSFSLASLPSSLGQLSALTALHVSGYYSLTHLPATVSDLRSLKILRLRSCDLLQRLPEGLGRLTGVVELRLEDMGGLLELPEGLGGMLRLEDLMVSGYSYRGIGCQAISGLVRAIPESLGDLWRLTRLTLRDLPELDSLPDSVGNLCSLREIHLICLNSLKDIPESLGQLRSLEFFRVEQCGLASLPESLGDLSVLARFHMLRCHQVERLPESMGGLQSLEELRIESCMWLRCLPLGLAKVSGLRELQVRHCRMFRDEWDVIPRLRGLRFLGLVGCRLVECLPDGTEKLTRLQLIKCSPAMLIRHYSDSFYRIMDVDIGSLRG